MYSRVRTQLRSVSGYLSNSNYLLWAFLIINGGWYLLSIRTGGLWLDEVLYARAGYSILSGNPFVNPTHMFAPLGKYIIGIGQLILGKNQFGARIGVVLVSILVLTIPYVIAKRLGEPLVGLLSVIAVSSIPLFVSHATSAMLDVPLVGAVTALCGLVILESKNMGGRWRDIAFGIFFILASSTKSYGVIYAIGPLIVYSVLRHNAVQTRRFAVRVGGGMSGAFIIIFLPLMLASPPNYYGGASLPDIVKSIFDIPLIGGITYSFGASLYHNITRHGANASPSLPNIVFWVIEGGPLVITGFIVSVGNYLIPKRLRLTPWWVPPLLIFPPIVMFTLVIPKGFARYALPVFPIAIFFGIFLCIESLRKYTKSDIQKKIGLFVLFILIVSPASAFFIGNSNPSADSQYDDVSSYLLSSSDENIVIIAQQSIVLKWHLGDIYVEKYNFNPTEPVEFTLGSKNITVFGLSSNHPESYEEAEEQIRKGGVDYIVFNMEPKTIQVINIPSCGDRVETWRAYSTGEYGTHQVSIWRLNDCD